MASERLYAGSEHAAARGRWEHDRLDVRLRSALPLLRLWSGREFRVRYRQSALGIAWSVAQPVFTVAIYGVILTGIFHVTGGGLPYLAFAFAGLAPWVFTSNAIGLGFSSILSASAMVSKVYFPRELIPLATVGAVAIDLGVGTALLLIIAGVQGVGFSITLMALPLVYATLMLFVGAIVVIGAALTVFMRDIRLLVPLLMQLLFIGTPIMYPAALIPSRFAWINSINPLAVAVEGTRDTVLRHVWPNWSLLGAHAVVGLCLFVLAVVYVRSVEPRIADVI